MLTPLPPAVALAACPGCGSVLPMDRAAEDAHVAFHVRTGDVRNGDPCPLDPWAQMTATISGYPGSALSVGGTVSWPCGHHAVVR